MDLVACLLPSGPLLHLETWSLDETAAQLTLRLASMQVCAPCPVCQCPTQHIHSHYTRTVADLPWAHLRVVLQLGVRKFFCANARCARRIFTERLPQLLAPWARRTQRLGQRLGSIAVALGGAAGALLSQHLGMPTSRNTLLRLLRKLPVPSCATPTVLGVDDFALRKRHTYGTILVDLARRQPVALLPERTAAPVAQWLREHPGVEVITRDRSSAYADGARQGAPAATQVADRFHLVQNLAEALTEVFTTQYPALDAVNAAARQQPVLLPDGTAAVPVPPPATPPRAQQQAAQRAAQRQVTYDAVWALHRQGLTVPTIAAQVGHSRHTIERYLRLPTWPAPPPRSTYGRSVLNPYQDYILARWNAGCRIAMPLFRELQQRGYTGSYRRVAAYASRLRHAQGLAPRRQGRRQTLPVVAEPACPPLTPRRATWLVLGRAEQRTEVEAQQLTQLHAQSAEVAEAIDLAQDFAQLVRQRQPAQLDPWLQRAASSPLEALRRFAQGLYEDYAAVKAGVTGPWSNGPVEGHINRLKMLKRQMYGRAHLDLLNRRFLLAPRCERTRVAHAKAAAAARAPPTAGHPLHQKWPRTGFMCQMTMGLVASLARPGGNVTGVANWVDLGFNAKRLQLLLEAVPGVTRVAALQHGAFVRALPARQRMQHAVEEAARALGVHLQIVEVDATDELAGAFVAMTRAGAEALFVFNSPFLITHSKRIAELAVQHRLPSIDEARRAVVAGGLMSYSASVADTVRRAATYVDKILKGAKPAELPVEQPAKFELVINLKTAKALGITIPPTLLFQADELIR